MAGGTELCLWAEGHAVRAGTVGGWIFIQGLESPCHKYRQKREQPSPARPPGAHGVQGAAGGPRRAVGLWGRWPDGAGIQVWIQRLRRSGQGSAEASSPLEAQLLEFQGLSSAPLPLATHTPFKCWDVITVSNIVTGLREREWGQRLPSGLPRNRRAVVPRTFGVFKESFTTAKGLNPR